MAVALSFFLVVSKKIVILYDLSSVSRRMIDMNEVVSNSDKTRMYLIGSAVVTGVLYVIPFGGIIAYPLLLLSTLAHEMGHGITAELVGGDFIEFALYFDASGVATSTRPSSRIANALISAGGLIGPAVVAAILFWLGKSAKGSKIGLQFLGVFLILADLWLVSPFSNTFGFCFIGGVGILSLLIGRKGGEELNRFVVLFTAIQLSLSVFSRSDYLFVKEAQTAIGTSPSDVQNIALNLFLPYWFWGGVCGLISLLCLFWGMKVALQKE